MEIQLYDNSAELLTIIGSLSNEKQFDILLLEYDENDNDGIKLAHKLRSMGYIGQIIFLANNKLNNFIHNSKVEEIFEAQGTEYFLKINSLRRFESVLNKVVNLICQQTTEYIQFGRLGGEYRQIAIHDIRYFDIYKNLVAVHFKNEKFEFLSTLSRISNQLCERNFIRIHRSYMVSLVHIRRFMYEEVEMSCGTKLPVGRSYYTDSKRDYNKYLVSKGIDINEG